jgi:hypothetical protein
MPLFWPIARIMALLNARWREKRKRMQHARQSTRRGNECLKGSQGRRGVQTWTDSLKTLEIPPKGKAEN